MSTSIPISESSMIRLREVEEELDQQHGLLHQVEREMEHLGDTDVAIEYKRLHKLVEQASAQAQKLMTLVTEDRGNAFPKRRGRQ